MSKKIGMIADDFTGANDSGVQLAVKGLRASVILDASREPQFPECDVLIFDTDSRDMPAEKAKAAVHKAALLLKQQGYHHLYKKIDSTLRGNIGVELLSLEEVYEPDLLVIAPAFPKMGRTTRNGVHFVYGTPISETEFGKDPKTPVTESDISTLLYQQTGRKAAVLTKEIFFNPETNFQKTLDRFLAEDISWFVCDAETNADLKLLLSRFLNTGKRIIWVGSAGLIEHLPEGLYLSGQSLSLTRPTIKKTLTVSGSLSQITRDQLEAAAELDDVAVMSLDVRELLKTDFSPIELRKELKSLGSNAQNYIIYVEPSEENRQLALHEGEKYGWEPLEISRKIADSLGLLANEILHGDKDIQGLVLTGGDTAKAICSKLGLTEMELVTEIEPGLPFGKLIGKNKAFWGVTKAGGFGSRDSLIHAIHYMTNEAHYM